MRPKRAELPSGPRVFCAMHASSAAACSAAIGVAAYVRQE